MARYPIISPASTIACPRHRLAVALSEDGRIMSSCPRCLRVAVAAEQRMLWKQAERLAELESWSICA